jgi:hypothetical protein
MFHSALYRYYFLLIDCVQQLEAALRRIEEIAVGMEGGRGEVSVAPKNGIAAMASRLKGGSKKLNSVYPL